MIFLLWVAGLLLLFFASWTSYWAGVQRGRASALKGLEDATRRFNQRD